MKTNLSNVVRRLQDGRNFYGMYSTGQGSRMPKMNFRIDSEGCSTSRFRSTKSTVRPQNITTSCNHQISVMSIICSILHNIVETQEK